MADKPGDDEARDVFYEWGKTQAAERLLGTYPNAFGDLRDLIAAKVTAARQAAAQDAYEGATLNDAWQPIATAPKDGTHILVWPYWSNQPVAEVQWVEYKRVPSRWEASGGSWCRANPTHWMPLPEPPALAAREAGRRDAEK